jgi:hypothetical protein
MCIFFTLNLYFFIIRIKNEMFDYLYITIYKLLIKKNECYNFKCVL